MIALIVALGSLMIALREHRVFMRGLEARARLEVTLRVVNPPGARPDGLVEMTGNTGTLVVELGVKNCGDRAAGETILNVLVPEGVEARWSGPRGEDRGPEAKQRVRAPDETFELPGRGDPAAAWYLSKSVPRVSLKGAIVGHVAFRVTVPSSGEQHYPMRASATCDELPDDVDEVRTSLPIRIRAADQS